jgi:hypothetical protein
VHLLRVEEVPQGAGFFTAARAQDIRRAAVAAVAALETATAKAVAPPPPLVGDAVTEPASVGHYPAAVAALETAVCVAARNTALKASPLHENQGGRSTHLAEARETEVQVACTMASR